MKRRYWLGIPLVTVFAVAFYLLLQVRGFYHWSDWTPEDTTETGVTETRGPDGRDAALLSSFFGLDNAAPGITRWVICPDAPGNDGMPVVFSHEVDLESLQAGDFRVTRASGALGEVVCVTLSPANDTGEWRTVLLIGEFGSVDDQPVRVEIRGNVLSLDGTINFQGASVGVVPLEAGPSITLVKPVTDEQMAIGRSASRLPWGGSSGCPEGTAMALRVTWEGGVTKPGGAEVDDRERNAYSVKFADREDAAAPDALGDLGDGDNNHLLCFRARGTAAEVAFPAGLMTDPREDLNPATRYRLRP